MCRRKRVIDGKFVQDRHYSVQLQHQGRRTRFPLKSANKAKAADLALSIYLDLLKLGWDKTIQEHKSARKNPDGEEEDLFIERPTVGDLIRVDTRFVSRKGDH